MDEGHLLDVRHAEVQAAHQLPPEAVLGQEAGPPCVLWHVRDRHLRRHNARCNARSKALIS